MTRPFAARGIFGEPILRIDSSGGRPCAGRGPPADPGPRVQAAPAPLEEEHILSTAHPSPGVTRKAGIPQGIVMALTAFLPILAIISLVPAVPTLIQHFGAVPHAQTLIPLMITAPGLMIALTASFAGWFADRLGRRRLLLGATLLYGICGTVPLYVDSLLPIFISRLGVGLSEAVVLTMANTMLLDYFDMRGRRIWLTVQGVIGPILGTIVYALSGYLTGMVWNGAFWIYGSAFLLFIAMYIWMYEPTGQERHADEPQIDDTVFPWGRMIGVMALTFVIAALYYIYTINGGSAFHSLDGASPERIGVMMSIASLAVPVGALIFGYISRLISSAQVLGIVLLLVGAGMIGVGYSTDVVQMGVSAFLQQIGAGMAISALIFWVSTLFGPQHRGRVMGCWCSAFFAGMFVSPLFFSAVREMGGGDVLLPFRIFGPASIVIALALYLAGVGKTRQMKAERQATAQAVAH